MVASSLSTLEASCWMSGQPAALGEAEQVAPKRRSGGQETWISTARSAWASWYRTCTQPEVVGEAVSAKSGGES